MPTTPEPPQPDPHRPSSPSPTGLPDDTLPPAAPWNEAGSSSGRGSVVLSVLGVLSSLGLGRVFLRFLLPLLTVSGLARGLWPSSPAESQPLSQQVTSALAQAQQAVAGRGTERLLWDDVGGSPVAVTIAGADAVLGRVRVGSGDQLYIVAYDAATLQPRWRSGPYGSYTEGYRSTFHAVVGERVVISDFRANLHLVDLQSGETVQTIALTDRVADLCVFSERHQVWVRQVDERNLLVDVDGGAVSIDSGRSRTCPAGSRSVYPDRTNTEHSVMYVPGVRVVREYVDGALGVAAGVKSPGTPIPYAVGFYAQSRGRAVRWKALVPSVDVASVRELPSWDQVSALGFGRYVTVYGVGSKGWRLAAFDAQSGARLWDVLLHEIFAVDNAGDIVLSKGHVYVVRTSSLDVLDATTGQFIGEVGG